MECNNTYCYWCMVNTCCHEDEEVHIRESQTPNQLDCPDSRRKDFEEVFWGMYEDLYLYVDKTLLSKLSFEKMIELHKILKEELGQK